MPSVLPARSRHILFSASASDLLRRSCVSSCVSSPMAKYASCSRAHGPQKATPRISTTAGRGQGLFVLLRTWHGTPIIASVKKTPLRKLLDRFFKGVACAEGRDLLGRNLHLLSGLGIPALPGLALPHGELPEARNLNLFTALERFGHYLLEGLEVPLGLALGDPGLLRDPLDELLLLHGCSFLRSSSASWPACLGCLPSVIREPEPHSIPSFAAGLAERMLWWRTVGYTPSVVPAFKKVYGWGDPRTRTVEVFPEGSLFC